MFNLFVKRNLFQLNFKGPQANQRSRKEIFHCYPLKLSLLLFKIDVTTFAVTKHPKELGFGKSFFISLNTKFNENQLIFKNPYCLCVSCHPGLIS